VFKVKKKILIFSSLACFLLLLSFFSIPALKVPFLIIFKYPLNLVTLIRREMGAIIFYHRNFIQNENSREEIDSLRHRLNAEEEINLENVRLNNLLSFKKQSPYKLVAARVIGRSPDSWSSTLIIDKGSFSGIRRGMVTMNYLGLIGRVIEAGQFTSKILLINDPNLSVSAMVQRSRQEGLVSGTLGSHLIMRYLPKESDIKINDIIITSGLNEIYPKGLLIGSVIDIRNEFSGLSNFAVIKPAINLFSIEEVLIVAQ
jgi:rod shape-determining protein MreC